MNIENLTPDEEIIHTLGGQIKLLQKKLEIVTKALKRIHQPTVGDIYNFETDELDYTKLQDIAYKALKEIDLIGTSMSQAKEEA